MKKTPCKKCKFFPECSGGGIIPQEICNVFQAPEKWRVVLASETPKPGDYWAYGSYRRKVN
jgi:hypothetical protein